MANTQTHHFGWHPDAPDARDFVFPTLPGSVSPIPAFVDMRYKMPPVLDQGNLGSCVGNAVAAQMNALKTSQLGRSYPHPFSRLFIYYNARKAEGTERIDAGCQIRDAIKAVAKRGVCVESRWPYNINRFAAQPSKTACAEALAHQALTYERVLADAFSLRAALAEGFPVTIGFLVYASFYDAEKAPYIAPFPKQGENRLGGHAVLAVGYDESKRAFLCRNSWGAAWADGGHFWLPYAYVDSSNVGDFWVIKLEE